MALQQVVVLAESGRSGASAHSASPARPERGSGRGEAESTGQLIATATDQLGQLVRQEMALAKAELADNAKRAGTGAGLFGGAGVVALYGLAALVATAIIALDLVLPLWLAALIVAVVLFAVAGVMALLGKKQVTRAAPPGEHTIDNVKADIETVKGGHRS